MSGASFSAHTFSARVFAAEAWTRTGLCIHIVVRTEKIRERGTAVKAGGVRQEMPAVGAVGHSKLADHPDCPVFHSSAWLRVLQETYGFTPLRLTENEFQSLPIMEVDSWLTGKRGVSLPFTDHCAPIGFSDSSLEKLVNNAVEFGAGRGWKYFELRCGANLPESLRDAKPSVSFAGHTLKLSRDTDALHEGLNESVQRALRKAMKSGLTVEFSRTLEATRTFYALHCRTRRNHGLPPQPFRFFKSIHENLLARDRGIIVSAVHGGVAIASAMFFHSASEAIYKFGASNPAFQQLRGNNLVMWEAIKWFAQRDTALLDFGRTSVTNLGLRRFKLGWGCKEQPVFYYRFDLRRKSFVTQKDESTGWHSRVFKTMPVGFARLAGAFLYKHVG